MNICVSGSGIKQTHKYCKTCMTRNRSKSSYNTCNKAILCNIKNILQCSKSERYKHCEHYSIIGIIKLFILPCSPFKKKVFAYFLCRSNYDEASKTFVLDFYDENNIFINNKFGILFKQLFGLELDESTFNYLSELDKLCLGLNTSITTPKELIKTI
mgnify:CR=1 FL=1